MPNKSLVSDIFHMRRVKKMFSKYKTYCKAMIGKMWYGQRHTLVFKTLVIRQRKSLIPEGQESNEGSPQGAPVYSPQWNQQLLIICKRHSSKITQGFWLKSIINHLHGTDMCDTVSPHLEQLEYSSYTINDFTPIVSGRICHSQSWSWRKITYKEERKEEDDMENC